MYSKRRLVELFRERALTYGDFTLASGRKSRYYLDSKQVVLSGEGLLLASMGLLAYLLPDWYFAESSGGVSIEVGPSKQHFDAVGGMSIGADPLVAGVLAAAAGVGLDLQGFLVRKEAKGHGTRRFIEGPLRPGDRVVIVEDVVTTGGSSLLAVDRVQEFGCQVALVLALVDRREGAAEAFAARGIPFRSLLTIEDIIEEGEPLDRTGNAHAADGVRSVRPAGLVPESSDSAGPAAGP